jgi:hypothetical protein
VISSAGSVLAPNGSWWTGNGLLILLKHAAALRDDFIQGLDGIEVSVYEWLVDQRPKVLGGL